MIDARRRPARAAGDRGLRGLARARPVTAARLLTGRVAGLLGVLVASAVTGPAAAQVVFDGTLGAPGAAPTDGATGFLLVEQARGRTVASGGRTHLFHSFAQFDVAAGETVEFRAADTVQTVFSRITAAGPSSVAGNLRVRTPGGLAAPDLFLMNPNGLIFSGVSRLDTAGAFVASTAQAVRFGDGARFSAVDTGAPLPSTAAPPDALVFDAAPGGGAGEIAFDAGRVLSSSGPDQERAVSLTFVGREIRATGLGGVIARDATVQMAAAGSGAVVVPLDLASMAAQGVATGTVDLDGDAATFSVQTNSTLADQGRVVIRGGELVLRNAQILAGGDGAQGADTIAVDIGVGGDVSLAGSSARIDSRSSSTAGPGGIRIDATRVDVGAGASIGLTQNDDAAGSGRIEIEANEVGLDGAFAEIKTTVNGAGDGGRIEISAERLRVTNDARIQSEVLGGASGTGGAIDIDADHVELTSLGDVLSVTAIGSAGDGGAIDARGQSLVVDDFSRILAGSAGTGRGGNITLDFDDITLGEGAFVATGPLFNPLPGENFSGAAGALTISATHLTLLGGAQVSTTTDGDGDAGDLTLRIADRLLIEGTLTGSNRASGLFARSGLGAGSTARGEGGAIDLEAARVELRDGGQIGIESLGEGNAGAARLRVGSIALSGGSAIRGTAIGAGATGEIAVEATGDVLLVNGSAIQSTAPLPPGATSPPDPENAGDVSVRAGGRIVLRDARLSTASARTGSGNIALSAGRDITLAGSEVTTTVDSAGGQGGDIAIDASVLAVAGGGVRANATGTNGAAGNVVVRATEGIVLVGGGVVEARADRGVAGDVILAGPETNLAGELAGLAARRQEARDSVRDPCAARAARTGSFEIRTAAARARRPQAPAQAAPPAPHPGPGMGDVDSDRDAGLAPGDLGPAARRACGRP